MCAHQNERVLVTGATGAIGPVLVDLLLQSGFSVRTFSRRPAVAGFFRADVENVAGDITDATAVARAIDGISNVLHLAALLHVVDPPPSLRADYERINLRGTENVVHAASQSDVRRMVFFSTIAVYGDSGGRVLTEHSPTRPASYYAETKLAAEKIVLAAQARNGPRLGTVLRLGAVYGPRIKGNYQRLLTSLSRGRFVPVGHGNNRRTLVADRDVARAALLAMQHSAAAGQVYNVSDGEFHTLNEIVAAMCSALGRRPPAISLPVAPVRAAAGVIAGLARLGNRKPPVSRTAIDKYTEDIAVDSRRIQSELGFRPEIDLQTGWRIVTEEMRRNGTLS